MQENKNEKIFKDAIGKIEEKINQFKQQAAQNENLKMKRKLMELQFVLDLAKEQIQDENLNRTTR